MDKIVVPDNHSAKLFLHRLVARGELLGPLFNGFTDAHWIFCFRLGTANELKVKNASWKGGLAPCS